MFIILVLTIIFKVRFNSSKNLRKSDSEPFAPDPLSKKPDEVQREPENAWDYLDEKMKKKGN